jgi:hypothetical protein
LEKRDNFEDLDEDGRVISKWTFKKWNGYMLWLRTAAGGGLL